MSVAEAEVVPESLQVQANVYAIKGKEREGKEQERKWQDRNMDCNENEMKCFGRVSNT